MSSVLSLLYACAPQIGDDCETSLDCSAQSTRLCDQTQPGGYCTLPNCERGTCPDEAVCVLFRPDKPRLATSFCMLECDTHGDCRGGYRCLGSDGTSRQVLDGNHKFCGREAPPEAVPTMSLPDGGVGSDAGPDDDDAGSD